MKKYRINPGYSFRDADDNVRGAGDTIELPSDVVAQQPNSVTLIEDEEPAHVDSAAVGES